LKLKYELPHALAPDLPLRIRAKSRLLLSVEAVVEVAWIRLNRSSMEFLEGATPNIALYKESSCGKCSNQGLSSTWHAGSCNNLHAVAPWRFPLCAALPRAILHNHVTSRIALNSLLILADSLKRTRYRRKRIVRIAADQANRRTVPTTNTRITASITAYSAMSCPASSCHNLCRR
jgi:hypothetical protein